MERRAMKCLFSVPVLSEAVLVLVIARAEEKNPQMTQMAQISEELWLGDDIA
jgi:hypothetical protein